MYLGFRLLQRIRLLLAASLQLVEPAISIRNLLSAVVNRFLCLFATPAFVAKPQLQSVAGFGKIRHFGF